MPKINMNDLNKYGNSGGGNFFRLQDDHDKATVRFMLEDSEDLNEYIYFVHEVNVPGSKYPRMVNCLREYNDPVSDCPFCAASVKTATKVILPLYNVKEKKVQMWTRGKNFISKMTSLCTRYKNLVSHTFEIERCGEAQDQKTTYEIYEMDRDDTELEDLPEIPDVLGLVVMDKTADDMEFYLEADEFPPDDDEDSAPVRRRSRKDVDEDDEDDEEEEERPRRRKEKEDRGRRTPASEKPRRRPSRNEDKF